MKAKDSVNKGEFFVPSSIEDLQNNIY